MNVIRTEQIVIASILTSEGNPGPSVCTALAYAPDYWESPEAAKLAEGIRGCINKGWRTVPRNVARLVSDEYKGWVDHPTFKDGLPLSCAEDCARDLLPLYRNKRIIAVVAKAYEKMLTHPEKAREWALDLKIQLGE